MHLSIFLTSRMEIMEMAASHSRSHTKGVEMTSHCQTTGLVPRCPQEKCDSVSFGSLKKSRTTHCGSANPSTHTCCGSPAACGCRAAVFHTLSRHNLKSQAARTACCSLDHGLDQVLQVKALHMANGHRPVRVMLGF